MAEVSAEVRLHSSEDRSIIVDNSQKIGSLCRSRGGGNPAFKNPRGMAGIDS